MARICSTAIPTKVFKPEKHWKRVQPDEAIPKGLHVRINLQTGEKEAKLLDENESSAQGQKLTPEQLKVYVKNVKNEADKLKEVGYMKIKGALLPSLG